MTALGLLVAAASCSLMFISEPSNDDEDDEPDEGEGAGSLKVFVMDAGVTVVEAGPKIVSVPPGSTAAVPSTRASSTDLMSPDELSD